MNFFEKYRKELFRALDDVDLGKIETAIEWLRQVRDNGKQIFVCGNGGSASTASHFTCDMMKCASEGKEKKFRVIALADAIPTVLAYANDVSYDSVFIEQLKNFAGPGDIVISISGSGNSMNVVNAVEYANSIGCRTIGLTGRDGGLIGQKAQLNIHVPEPHMGRIEDVHMMVCHMICYYFMEEDKAN